MKPLLSLLAAFLVFSFAAKAADCYSVQGVLRIQYSPLNAAFGYDTSYGFDVTIEGCRWNIKLAPLSGAAPRSVPMRGIAISSSPAAKEEIGSDGGDFFYVHAVPITPARPGDSHNNAARGSAPAPYGVDSKFIMLWCTYASECYFANRAGDQIHSLIMLGKERYANGGGLVKANWRLASEGLRLPVFIDCTGYIGYPDPMPKILKNTIHSMTNTTLRRISSTNVFGVEFPQETVATYFGYQFSTNKVWTIKEEKTFHMTTTNIVRSIAPSSFLPVMPEHTTYSDMRWWRNDPQFGVSASVTTSGWPVIGPKETDLALRGEIARKQAKEKWRSTVLGRYSIFIGVLGFAFLLALLLYRPASGS